MKARNCPICEETARKFITTLNFLLFDDSPLHGEGELVSCAMCGAVYYVSKNTAENYKQYYAFNTNYLRKNSRGMGTPCASELERYRNTSCVLRRHTDNTLGLVADIGCGQGGCLQTLSEEGWERLVGIDPLEHSIEAVRRAGLKAELGVVEHIPLPDASCAAVILGHVLEHLYTPKHALAEIRRVLKDEGVLYIEVPDAAAYPATAAAPFCDCIHEHINLFDSASITNCLAVSGFSLLEQGIAPLPGGVGGDVSLYAVFRKQVQPLPVVPNYTLAAAMNVLAHAHTELTRQTVELLAKEKFRIHLWGLSSYGMHIAWLLVQSGLELQVYDVSELRRTHTLCGKPIMPPESLLKHWSEHSRLVIPHSSYIEEIVRQAGTMIDPARVVRI